MTQAIARYMRVAAILWVASTAIAIAQVESAQVRIDGMT